MVLIDLLSLYFWYWGGTDSLGIFSDLTMASSLQDSPCVWGFGRGISWLWHLPRYLWRGQPNRICDLWPAGQEYLKARAGRALRANINIHSISYKLVTWKSLQSLNAFSKHSEFWMLLTIWYIWYISWFTSFENFPNRFDRKQSDSSRRFHSV